MSCRSSGIAPDDRNAQRTKPVAKTAQLRVIGTAEAVRARVVDVDEIQPERDVVEEVTQRLHFVVSRIDAAENDPGDRGAASGRLLVEPHGAGQLAYRPGGGHRQQRSA